MLRFLLRILFAGTMFCLELGWIAMDSQEKQGWFGMQQLCCCEQPAFL